MVCGLDVAEAVIDRDNKRVVVSLHVVITSFLLIDFPFGRSDEKGTFPQNERPADAHFRGAIQKRRVKKQPIRVFANRLQESPVWCLARLMLTPFKNASQVGMKCVTHPFCLSLPSFYLFRPVLPPPFPPFALDNTDGCIPAVFASLP